MSFSRPVALAMLVLTIAAPGFVFAAGNVLLPSDTNNSDNGSSSPNLGLAPVAPAPKDPTTTNTTNATPSPGTAPTAAKTQIPSSTLPNLTSTSLPLAAAMKAPSSSPAMPQPWMPQMPPTSIIQMPVPPPMTNIKSSNLPNTLSITVADKYVWGTNDVTMITRRLGIPSDKITSTCHLSVSGMLQTDKNPWPFDTGTLYRADVRYDGQVTGATLYLQALCDRVPLPTNLGPVIQLGDKYEVMLGLASCPAPTKSAQQLLVHYAGNSTVQCEYR